MNPVRTALLGVFLVCVSAGTASAGVPANGTSTEGVPANGAGAPANGAGVPINGSGCPSGMTDVGGVCVPGGCSAASGPVDASTAPLLGLGAIGVVALLRRRPRRDRA